MATHIDELYEAHDHARRLQDEVDRLRAVNAELLEALERIACGDVDNSPNCDSDMVRGLTQVADAAIAKAEAATPANEKPGER